MWSQRKAPQARVSAVESPGPLRPKALARREPLVLPSPTLASSRPMTLELDVALLAQLEGAARARRQPPANGPMTLEALAVELLTVALRRETQRARAEASVANLTPRQREVAWLAARGYTNLRIAETLVVSPETVKTHMRHVLEKLGLRAKAQLQMLLSASPSGSQPNGD